MNSVANLSIDPVDFAGMRQAMVTSQLRTNAVSDQRVVAAMASIPREDHVPVAARDIAYRDTALPAGEGRWINAPMATGRLLTAAELRADDRVLLIGAAAGYAAAILAEVVADVVAVEQDAALVDVARRQLELRRGVTIIEGPLTEGHVDRAPYDVLVVDGAVERLPDTLIAQLKTGGRIVSGLLERGVTRLASGRRTEGGLGLVPFADADCVILPGFAPPRPFRF